jgi:acylphosphatase
MEQQSAIVATVSGRVHGVGFRYTAQRVASELGLGGWVMNQPDGTVRTWAQGPAQAVARYRGFLEEGPPAARVSDVLVEPVVPDPSLSGFRIRY